MKRSKLSSYKVWIIFLFFIIVNISGLLSLSGCQSKAKPSFIILAVDNLSFNSFACSDDKSRQTSGLSSLCQESLRFTHAYTASTSSAGAMASLLTGAYPYRHHIHRSRDRLNSKEISVAELSSAKGYRTSFWSGSPTILRKTGLARGFDYFDDLSFLDKKNYLVSLNQQTELFLNWQNESNLPFFSIIYNSELESLNEGESEISSFEKFDEKLSNFIDQLKKSQNWEQNYFIIVGLQGGSDYNRIHETRFSNLHSENTNITLFIKPPRQKGDEGIHWKIDTPISLTDLGYTLKKLIAENYQSVIDENFPQIDLARYWNSNNQTNSEILPRRLLIESANTWSESIETRFAILYKNLLYIEQSEADEIYNTLNDGLETIDVSAIATITQNDFKNENRQILSEIRNNYELARWNVYQNLNYKWIETNRNYWAKPNSRASILETELARIKIEKTSQPLSALVIDYLENQNRSAELKKINLFVDSNPQFLSDKSQFFEEARRQSLNLSLENIWGLWSPAKNWLQAPFIKTYQ